jgi:hypothetical protein
MRTEPSLISTCDSLNQKLNIDVGKFLVENQVIMVVVTIAAISGGIILVGFLNN